MRASARGDAVGGRELWPGDVRHRLQDFSRRQFHQFGGAREAAGWHPIGIGLLQPVRRIYRPSGETEANVKMPGLPTGRLSGCRRRSLPAGRWRSSRRGFRHAGSSADPGKCWLSPAGRCFPESRDRSRSRPRPPAAPALGETMRTRRLLPPAVHRTAVPMTSVTRMFGTGRTVPSATLPIHSCIPPG